MEETKPISCCCWDSIKLYILGCFWNFSTSRLLLSSSVSIVYLFIRINTQQTVNRPLVELQRGINYGSTGYFQQQIYQIAVLLETDKIKVWIDSILEIDYQPHSTQFTNGLFGLYANSQQDLYVSFNLLCYPSASSSPTTSPTPSASATSSQSVSPSRTPSRTATRTPTKSPSLSSSISITPSISVTKSVSVSSSRTPSRTPTSSRSYSRTPRGTRTPTSTITPTITVTRTITPTITPTSTQSFTPTITPTVSDTPTKTITITPTSYPSRTPQASQSATPSASTSGFPYNYYYITDAPSKTAAASVTQSHSVSKSPSDSVTISPSATSTPTPSISLTISISPSATPSFNLCLISDCEDYDPCTDDSCNFELGVCVNVNNYLCGLLGGSGEVPTRSMTPSLKLLPPVFLPPESLSPSPTSNFLPKVSGGFGIQDNNNNKFGAAHHNDPIIGASSTGVVTFIGAVAISCAFCFAFAIGCAADKKAKKDRLQEVMNIIETTGDGYDPSRIVDSALFSPNH